MADGEAVEASNLPAPQGDLQPRGLLGARPAPSLGLPLQAKLVVGPADDPLEREADAAADRVMRMPDSAAPLVEGSEAAALRRQPAGGADAVSSGGGPAPASVDNVLHTPGAALDPATRALVEPRFGQRFGDVRVHTDPGAARSAEQIEARAYTSGNHIAFAAGQYAPQTPAGLRLLSHELGHVVQQGEASAAGHHSHVLRQGASTAAEASSEDAKTSSVGPTQPSIPSGWPQRLPITWGSTGEDVHYLRIRLNQVLVGRQAAIALDDDPAQARFSKADADAIQAFQQAMKVVKPGGFIEGGGAVGVASARTIELLRSKSAEPDQAYLDLLKIRQPLLDGALADSGDYDAKNGFKDSTLQKILVYYSKNWAAIDWRLATGDQTAAPATQAGGDLSSKWVQEFPLWVNLFQDKLVNSPTWGKDEETVRALLTAFLRAHTKSALGGKLPATVAEFLKHVGKSELNRQSEDLVRGSIGNSVWCAQASSEALVRALQDAGLEPIPGPWQKHPEQLYMAWLTSAIKKRKVEVIGTPTSYQVSLRPGDRITVVSQSSPLTGHVATVVQDKGGSIHLVSGNAGGGGGSIRFDEVVRETPPEAYSYAKVTEVFGELSRLEKQEKEMAGKVTWESKELTEVPEDWSEPSKEAAAWMKVSKRIQDIKDTEIPALKAGHNAPRKAGVVWVVEVVRTSELDAGELTNASTDDLAELGLQRRGAQAKPE